MARQTSKRQLNKAPVKNAEHYRVLLDKNNIEENGVDGQIRFRTPVTISDDTEHWNGRRYDIPSMDVSMFDGKLRSDHQYGWEDILGKVVGLAKRGKKLTIDGIDFAVNASGLAWFAHDMVRKGWVTDLSVGVDPSDDPADQTDDGLQKNTRLAELSLVGFGNNPAAKMGEIAANTVKHAEAAGIETNSLRKFLSNNGIDLQTNSTEDRMKRIKNDRDFEVSIVYLVNGEVNRLTLKPGESVSVPEDQVDSVKAQIEQADEPADDGDADGDDTDTGDGEGDGAGADAGDGGDSGDGDGDGDGDGSGDGEGDDDDEGADQNARLQNQVKSLNRTVKKLQKNLLSGGAKAPGFSRKKPAGAAVNSGKFAGLEGKSWKQLTADQVNAYHKGDKEKLAEINAYHRQLMKDKAKDLGLDKNAIDEADYGNFVANPELLTQIETERSDYSQFLSVFNFQQTNSLEMAWLEGGDKIRMSHVSRKSGSDPADPDNRKPVREKTATPKRSRLEELAAVTPVLNAAVEFLAADLIGDVTADYREDYDRNLSELVVARLQQALEANSSNSVGYTASGVDTDLERLDTVRQAVMKIANGRGYLVMNEKTASLIASLLFSTANGSQLGTIPVENGDPFQTFWQRRVVIVPEEIMPTLGDDEYPTVTVADPTDEDSLQTVDITHAIFYADPSKWSGRQHNGLKFDISTQAAYIDGAGNVHSAWQDNETVLRGSMFRGGQIRRADRVAGVRAQDLLSS